LLEEMVDHTLGQVLDLFDVDLGTVRRWTGERSRPGLQAARMPQAYGPPAS
jgi:4-hydroxy-3-polyprenylbenzoate decarboxylase